MIGFRLQQERRGYRRSTGVPLVFLLARRVLLSQTNREQGMEQQQQASQTGAMKPDSSSATGVVLSVEHPIPPRRRLVKSASAAAAYVCILF